MGLLGIFSRKSQENSNKTVYHPLIFKIDAPSLFGYSPEAGPDTAKRLIIKESDTHPGYFMAEVKQKSYSTGNRSENWNSDGYIGGPKPILGTDLVKAIDLEYQQAGISSGISYNQFMMTARDINSYVERLIQQSNPAKNTITTVPVTP